MDLRSLNLAVALSVVAFFVGCSHAADSPDSPDSSDSPDSPGGAKGNADDAGTSSGGARNDGGKAGDSGVDAPVDGGEPGSSFEGGPGDVTGPRGLSCLGVLQCAGACPDENLDACVEDCLNQTSETSHPVTLAFVQCIADNECADSACIQASCMSELSACVADDATAAARGEPPSGPTPTGSMPTELVGLWSQVGLTSGLSYEFSADGTTIQAFSNETNYGCSLKTQLTSSGVTTVRGDSLIYHRLEGTLGTTTCGTVTAKPAEPADIAYQYALGTDSDGAPKLSLYRVNEDGTLSSPVELHR